MFSVVGDLTAVLALDADWLSALVAVFLTGLAPGQIAGLSRPWVLAIVLRAGVELGARAGGPVVGLILS